MCLWYLGVEGVPGVPGADCFVGVFGLFLGLKGDAASDNALFDFDFLAIAPSSSLNACSLFKGELTLGVDGPFLLGDKLSLLFDPLVGVLKGDGLAILFRGELVGDLNPFNTFALKSSRILLTTLGCAGILFKDGRGSFNCCWYRSAVKYAQIWYLAISDLLGKTGFFCRLIR